MPVHQDKILSLLASAKAYRAFADSLVRRLRDNVEEMKRGTLTPSAKDYAGDLWLQYHYEVLDLERQHSIVIQLTDQYYTEAIIRRNQKNKETQRNKRRIEGVEPKKIANKAKVFAVVPIKSPMGTEELSPEKQEELMENDIIKGWVNTPIKGSNQ